MLWRAITGYEGYYEVSTTGRIRSLDRVVIDRRDQKRLLRGHEMKLTHNADGYMVVNLRKFGKSEVVGVHILVATAFLPNPHNLPMVNHIDGVKEHNNIENLEWATYSYNNIHALQHKLRKPRSSEIVQLTEDGEIVDVYDSAAEAARRTGISSAAILQCVNHRTYSAGGFAWGRLSEGLSTIL